MGAADLLLVAGAQRELRANRDDRTRPQGLNVLATVVVHPLYDVGGMGTPSLLVLVLPVSRRSGVDLVHAVLKEASRTAPL